MILKVTPIVKSGGSARISGSAETIAGPA